MTHLSPQELLLRLLSDLEGLYSSVEEIEDLEPIIAVFCRHRRVLRLLLTLCQEE